VSQKAYFIRDGVRIFPGWGGGAGPLLLVGGDPYDTEYLEPVHTCARPMEVGDRIARLATDGRWMLGQTVTKVSERTYEATTPDGLVCVCDRLSDDWAPWDSVTISPPNPVWHNCVYPVDYDRKGKPIACNRGHMVPWVVAHKPSCCARHDMNPYLGPVTREAMPTELKAEYDAVLGEAA
jgi:hypothetical protein